MKLFEARYWEMLRAKSDPVSAGFTAELVHDYVLATAEHVMSPGVRPLDTLRAFPRGWWWPAMEVILEGERVPGSWRSDREYVHALAIVEPERFASAPLALIARQIRIDALFRAHRDQVTPLLREALGDPSCAHRSEVARILLMLSRAHEDEVDRALVAGQLPHAEWPLRWAGYTVEDGRLRRLVSDVVFEIAYEPGYLAEADSKAGPSWDPSARAHALGGRVEARHASGARVRMHHALTLDPVPEGLGVSLPRLVLGLDLAWCADEGVERWFAHDERGELIANDDRIDDHSVAYEESHPAIVVTRVQLAPIAGEALHRTWGEGGEARCDRVGGLAYFVQDASYPDCTTCGRVMPHLVSLDSRLPLDGVLDNGTRALWWGSGGVATCFWCDRCRISAWSWACT